MTETPYDLVVAAVLFRTAAAEVERMIAQVAAIPLRVHLILIDNDPDVPPSERRQAEVTRIATGANLGYGKAQNVAIERSAGLARYFLAANTDLVFAGEDIATLVRYMEKHPQVGLCAPRVRYPNGTLQHLCRLLPTPVDLVARRFFGWTHAGVQRDARYELRDWDYGREASIPFVSGCFMLMRRSVLDSLGGFDQRFFLYFEDLDLSRRFNVVSETRFVPEVEIFHDYRSRQHGSSRLLAYLIVSGIRYFSKWGWIWDPERDQINRRTRAALGLE